MDLVVCVSCQRHVAVKSACPFCGVVAGPLPRSPRRIGRLTRAAIFYFGTATAACSPANGDTDETPPQEVEPVAQPYGAPPEPPEDEEPDEDPDLLDEEPDPLGDPDIEQPEIEEPEVEQPEVEQPEVEEPVEEATPRRPRWERAQRPQPPMEGPVPMYGGPSTEF